jgi:hypothetical protein
LYYTKLIEQLQGSIVFTEKLIRNCSTGKLNANFQLEIWKSTEFSFVDNAHDLLINIFRFAVRFLLLMARVRNNAAKKITAFIRYVIQRKNEQMIDDFIQELYDGFDTKVRKEVKISLEMMIFKTVEAYKASKGHVEIASSPKKAVPGRIRLDSESSNGEIRRKVPIMKRVTEIKKANESTYASMSELKLKVDNSTRELVKNKESETSQSYKLLKTDSSSLDESKDKSPAQRRRITAKRY